MGSWMCSGIWRNQDRREDLIQRLAETISGERELTLRNLECVLLIFFRRHLESNKVRRKDVRRVHVETFLAPVFVRPQLYSRSKRISRILFHDPSGDIRYVIAFTRIAFER